MAVGRVARKSVYRSSPWSPEGLFGVCRIKKNDTTPTSDIISAKSHLAAAHTSEISVPVNAEGNGSNQVSFDHHIL
jgi:hypothetical protein